MRAGIQRVQRALFQEEGARGGGGMRVGGCGGDGDAVKRARAVVVEGYKSGASGLEMEGYKSGTSGLAAQLFPPAPLCPLTRAEVAKVMVTHALPPPVPSDTVAQHRNISPAPTPSQHLTRTDTAMHQAQWITHLDQPDQPLIHEIPGPEGTSGHPCEAALVDSVTDYNDSSMAAQVR